MGGNLPAEAGVVISHCEGDVVCKLTNPKIPYFNAFIYLENKQDVGKVDDIFGPMTDAVRNGTPLCASIYLLLCAWSRATF